MTKRQQQAKETRQRIIKTAQRLIAERKYENVSVDDIVGECGLAKGTFYHYFDSKESFFRYMERERYEQLTEQVEREDSAGSPMHCLENYLKGWVGLCLEDNIYFSKQWFHMVLGSRFPTTQDADTSLDVSMEHIGKYLSQGIRQGELAPDTPVEQLSRDITFAVIGAILYRCIAHQAFDLEGWAQGFVGQTLGSLLAPYRHR